MVKMRSGTLCVVRREVVGGIVDGLKVLTIAVLKESLLRLGRV